MGMIRQIGQCLVFPAQAFIDTTPIPGHKFDNPNHITQRVEHLVGNTKTTTAELRLDAEAIRQNKVLR